LLTWVGSGKEGWKETKNSSFLGLPKLLSDVSRMVFKVHKKMATRKKEKKLREREREREWFEDWKTSDEFEWHLEIGTLE